MIAHEKASGITKWFLKASNKTAFTNPLRDTISYLYGVPTVDSTLYRHEMVHVAQYQKEGKIKFIVKYLWFNVTKGYENNPYEIEAYRLQNK